MIVHLSKGFTLTPSFLTCSLSFSVIRDRQKLQTFTGQLSDLKPTKPRKGQAKELMLVGLDYNAMTDFNNSLTI